MQQMTQQSLNDAELDRLGDFLEGVGAPAMNLEMLDGFFAALICGPETVLPSEYLPQVLGEGHCFDSNDQAAEILGLVMRHWNTILGGPADPQQLKVSPERANLVPGLLEA